MSGPKLSSVQIEEARRRELERQRQERLRLEEARATYRNAEQEIVRRKEKLLLEIGETGKEADFWPGKNFDGLKQALVEKLSQIRMRAVTQTADAMREKKESVLGQFQAAHDLSRTAQQGRKEDIYIQFEGSDSFGSDPGRKLSEKQAQINRSNDLKVEEERLNELYISYCALCAALEKPAEELSVFEDAEALEEEIECLDALLEHRDEMAFVAEQIDDVMREYKFSLVSSTLLMEENVEKEESIYKVDDQSCIVVYTGSNGEVMMKAASISHDGDSRVQEGEDSVRHASLQQQISFCSLHPELVKALRERGVYLSQISYLPPSEEYAESVNIDKKKSERRSRRRAHDKKKMLEMPK